MVYRVAVSHIKSSGNFSLINDSQIGSIIGVGHVCDRPFSLEGSTLVLQSVALNGVQMDFPILTTKKINKNKLKKGEKRKELIKSNFT